MYPQRFSAKGAAWQLVLFGLCSAGCRPHVELQAPEPEAPPAERVEAYQRLKPSFQRDVQVERRAGGVGPVSVSTIETSVDFMELEDGTRVYHVGDIRSVVAPQSIAYEEAENSVRYASTTRWLYGAGTVAALAGIAVFVSGIVAGAQSENKELPVGILVAGGGISLGGLLTVSLGSGFRRKSLESSRTAFDAYDEGLRQRLSICQSNGEPEACR